jgi:DNA-binding transcriptional regulator LsrR (DeoR family)
VSETRNDDDLKTRVAWLYYVEGMTQDEVAQRVGLTRARVLRMLANARSDGSVQIRVTTRLTRCIELERRLERIWNLERAIVVPAPADPSSTNRIIGRELGAYLSAAVEPNMTIGLGWGTTLTNGLPAIEPREPRNITVISLLGGLTRVSEVNPSEFAWRVADRLSAACYLLTAPVFAPDAETRAALLRHPGIAEIFRRAQSLDMAVISFGDLAPHSLLARYELLTSDEIASLERAGAVGDILCHFVDAEGRMVDHPVNDRVVSVDLERLKLARRRVIASGGWNKVPVMLAGMRSVAPSVVITDETVAERLCLG